MTKPELIAKLAETQDVKPAEAGRRLEVVLDAIKTELLENEKVSIPGIGTLTIVVKKGREGEAFGKQYKTEDGKRVSFKKSKKLGVN